MQHPGPRCSQGWLRGLVCSHTSQTFQEAPQGALHRHSCTSGCPARPRQSYSHRSKPGALCSRKTRGDGRPGIWSITAVLPGGISSAPPSRAPIAPVGSHNVLLSHSCPPEPCWRRTTLSPRQQGGTCAAQCPAAAAAPLPLTYGCRGAPELTPRRLSRPTRQTG